ncbi:MAG: hypothetical protein J0H74_14970 [Chitinophagaceae bacterium]|nr:hypothetical protein [Chitinophagaceae bacterium]
MKKRRSEARQVHQYDKVIRENIEATLPGLISNVLGIDVVEAEELPDDLQHTKERHPDVLKKVTDQAGETFILHIEYQVSDEPKMVWRMAEYFVMLARQYGLEVRQYVIFIGQGVPTMARRLQCRQMQYYYQLITLSEIDYQLLLSASDPREKMLAILADFKGNDPTVIVEQIVAQIIVSSEGDLDQSKHINQLNILSQLRNFEVKIPDIMDSIAPYFSIEKDWGYIIGQHKGMEKGKRVIVKNLLRKTDFSIAKIADLAEVTEDFVKKVKKSLR